jgi:nucleoside-diphosphate-sugar epimerase
MHPTLIIGNSGFLGSYLAENLPAESMGRHELDLTQPISRTFKDF